MASDFGWNSIELQIEALIPGVLIVVEANALAISWVNYHVTKSEFMPTSDFTRGVIFVALAYSVGMVSSLLSRALVDTISERGPRNLVFGLFAHGLLSDAFDECQDNDPKFISDYNEETIKRKWEKVARWNAIYRSVLRRNTRQEEVDRRRLQGRFVRNLLLPAVGAPLIFFPIPLSLLLACVDFLFLVFLYAYAEYVNFVEAYDISMAKPKYSSKGGSIF
ncbi:MAG: hypothetical protein ABSF99_14055 [Anaerolineales bacterium]|jgi:hypothetical protein